MTIACRRRTVQFARYLLQNKSSNWPHPNQNQEGKRAEDGFFLPITSTPTLGDLTEVKLVGWVEGCQVTEETLAGKKKRGLMRQMSPQSLARRNPAANLHRRTSRALTTSGPRAIILAKSFAVPVEPFQKPAEVVTSDKSF